MTWIERVLDRSPLLSLFVFFVVLIGGITVLIGYCDDTTTTHIVGHCIVQTTTNGWETVLHTTRLCVR